MSLGGGCNPSDMSCSKKKILLMSGGWAKFAGGSKADVLSLGLGDDDLQNEFLVFFLHFFLDGTTSARLQGFQKNFQPH